MACQFEQTKNSNDREELQHICVLKMWGEMGEDQVDVEAESGDEVYNIDRTSDKIQNIRTGNESAKV